MSRFMDLTTANIYVEVPCTFKEVGSESLDDEYCGQENYNSFCLETPNLCEVIMDPKTTSLPVDFDYFLISGGASSTAPFSYFHQPNLTSQNFVHIFGLTDCRKVLNDTSKISYREVLFDKFVVSYHVPRVVSIALTYKINFVEIIHVKV